MQPGTELAVGIDLGGTKIAAVLVDSSGAALASRQMDTLASAGAEVVLDRLAGLANELIAAAPQPPGGLGIGVPGRVNPAEGIVYKAVNLGWDGVNLAASVRSRLEFDLPVYIQKDTNANALGEHMFGAAQGVADFVYLGIGSGLGSGIVSGGRLLNGATWIAGDLGHLSLDPHGLPCVCGLRGCAETLLSGPGLVRLTRLWIKERRQPTLLGPPDDFSPIGELTPALIVEAARSGDSLALAALNELGRCLGAVMAICVATLNPARFVIGGGLGMPAFDFLIPPARGELALRNIPDRWQDLAIVKAGCPSSAIGAACLVFEKLG